jgi:regulator of RNase E activity RraA
MSYQSTADFSRVTPEQISRARQFQAAILCDVAGRRGTMDARIRALSPAMTVCGPAYTVEVRPGDNLMFHVALAVAKAGDVIVVDGKADSTCALFGDLMVTQGAAAKLGGFVVDAASRDTAELAQGGLHRSGAGVGATVAGTRAQEA